MPELLVQFSTSTAFASGIIRRLTHSPFSHVDFYLPGEGLLGVSGPDDAINDPGGVLIRSFTPWPYMHAPKIARIQTTDKVIRSTLEFARSQIGKPFDNGALWHFIDDPAGENYKHRDWRDPAQWFCSEFALRSTEVGCLFHYVLVLLKDRASPADDLLMWNPFMPPDNIAEFLV